MEHQPADMDLLIDGCIKNDRDCQQKLYKHWYSYAMSVCMRYAHDQEEAYEILNDGFLKVFKNRERFERNRSFKSWLRTILIITALDQYRKNKKHRYQDDIEEARHLDSGMETDADLNYQELMALVQQLSPAYKAVFNLYVIDGFKHHEIAEKLGISEGTSKSNLTKARANLREMIRKVEVKENA